MVWSGALDCRQHDGHSTNIQIYTQCSHKDVRMNNLISVKEKSFNSHTVHLLYSMLRARCFLGNWIQLKQHWPFPFISSCVCIVGRNPWYDSRRGWHTHTRTYLSLGCVNPEPGAPGGPHYHREPPPLAHSHGQQGSLPALARSLGLGPRCHPGESHPPLLSPGPPQPRTHSRACQLVGMGMKKPGSRSRGTKSTFVVFHEREYILYVVIHKEFRQLLQKSGEADVLIKTKDLEPDWGECRWNYKK